MQPLSRVLAIVLLLGIVVAVPSLLIDLLGPGARPLWWRLPVTVALLVACLFLVRDALRGTSPTWTARLVWSTVFVSAGAALGLALAGASGDVPESDRLPPAYLAAVVGWRRWGALVPVVAVAAVQGAARWVAGTRPPRGVADDVMTVVVLGVVLAVALASVRGPGERLARRQESAARSVASAEERLSAGIQRVRWQADVHDGVLAALQLVQADRRPSAPERRTAAAAVGALSTAGPDRVWTGSTLADDIRRSAGAASSGAVVTVLADDATVPRSVAEVMVSATTECVRNVVRHAGTRGRCHVDVRALIDSVTVTVRDDGRGFSPSQAQHRSSLGLRVAVGQRLESVGGHVRYDTAPGAGATVRLLWQKDEGR